jgi:hypothetical protein
MMTLQDAAGPAGLAVNMLSRIAAQGMADPGLRRREPYRRHLHPGHPYEPYLLTTLAAALAAPIAPHLARRRRASGSPPGRTGP